jgi:hypothetical protein
LGQSARLFPAGWGIFAQKAADAYCKGSGFGNYSAILSQGPLEKSLDCGRFHFTTQEAQNIDYQMKAAAPSQGGLTFFL